MMTLAVEIHSGDEPLGEMQQARIRRHLRHLEERLVHFSQPVAIVTVRHQADQRQVTVDLRVNLYTRSGELVSQQAAGTADHAVRLAVEDIERQLERRLASQRGEPTYGVPSRRLPKEERPHPRKATTSAGSRDST